MRFRMLVTIVIVGLISILSIGIITLLMLNGSSDSVLEIIFPALGAFIVAGYLCAKEVFLKEPDSLKKNLYIANLEYSKGHLIPLQNDFAAKPYSVSKNDLLIKYWSEWRVDLSQRRDPDFDKDGKLLSSDSIFFEYFSYFVLKELSHRFRSGWKFDESNLGQTPFGKSGSSNSGIEDGNYEKIFLKEQFKAGDNRFLDLLPKTEKLQISMPKGSTFSFTKDSHSFGIEIKNPRFKGGFSFNMVKQVYKMNQVNDFFSHFTNALHSKFGVYNPDKTLGDLEGRLFNFNISFTQNKFYRFSDQTKLDKLYFEAILEYLKPLSWDNTGQIVEQIVNK